MLVCDAAMPYGLCVKFVNISQFLFILYGLCVKKNCCFHFLWQTINYPRLNLSRLWVTKMGLNKASYFLHNTTFPFLRFYLIFEIRSVEAWEEPLWGLHSKLMKDVASNPWCGSGSESHEGDLGKVLTKWIQLLEVGSKIVTPLWHTMGLINDKHGQLLPIVHRGEGWQQVSWIFGYAKSLSLLTKH